MMLLSILLLGRNKYQKIPPSNIEYYKDREGREVAVRIVWVTLRPQEGESHDAVIEVEKPRLWDIDDPISILLKAAFAEIQLLIFTILFWHKNHWWTVTRAFLNGGM